MSAGQVGLKRQIDSANDLQGVVRTMRAIAATSIHAYQQSVQSLADYHRAVELGLGVCLREGRTTARHAEDQSAIQGPTVVIVFGSDQGLVGPFDDVVVDHALHTLAPLPGTPEVWAVGERVHSRLLDAGLAPRGSFAVPNTVAGIAPLVGRLQLATDPQRDQIERTSLLVFHNRPTLAAHYEPTERRLLPLDARWRDRHAALAWPTPIPPEVVGATARTLRLLIREHLFISLFQACAESLAAENASRLAAMERADKNIDELLVDLQGSYHRLRQGAIDAELFDVIAGFEALSPQS